MSWIAASDPLALLAIAGGKVNTPSQSAGAGGSGSLDAPQQAVELGDPVPIVFGRRRNGKGGVFISPGATEARFENDTGNNVTAFYHLVLSEGQIDSIPVKDVFQRSCRVGTHVQNYSRRAGTWLPGNFIVNRTPSFTAAEFSFDSYTTANPTWYPATRGSDGVTRFILNGTTYQFGTGSTGVKQVRNTFGTGVDFTPPECPYFCGSIGAYPDMSTASFQITIPNGSDQWNRQVHFFIRGGMHVTRLADSVTGPSDNFADLVKWLLNNSGRVPIALVDNTALAVAATFLEANGLTCNCWLTTGRNYSDLLAAWAPYFLLCESNSGGKRGLRPLLPTNPNGTIRTTTVAWEYTFNEATILPGSFEINYTSLADRLPFVAQMTWRQQVEDDYGIIRTAEVRYEGTALVGPYESHDLSEFCTSEDHAVKVGAYILSQRVNTTHMIRFTARPQAHNTILVVGDIIRVTLNRITTSFGPTVHDYLYQVIRITKTLAGDVSYECAHFPIDDQGRSIIALEVSAAVGGGILLTSNKTGLSCDTNSSSDNTIPSSTGLDPEDLGIDELAIPGTDQGSLGGAGSNPSDGLDGDAAGASTYPPGSEAVPGAGIYPNTGVCGGSPLYLKWYKNGELLVTFDYSASPTITVTYAPGITEYPSFISATTGILAIGNDDVGDIYTSETICSADPSTSYTQSTTVQSGNLMPADNEVYWVFTVGASGYTSYGAAPYVAPSPSNPSQWTVFYQNTNFTLNNFGEWFSVQEVGLVITQVKSIATNEILIDYTGA